MKFETLADTAFVVRKTQIGCNAAERLGKDRNRAAIVIALEVAPLLGGGYAAFYPVGTNGRNFDANVKVTAPQTTPADLIQCE